MTRFTFSAAVVVIVACILQGSFAKAATDVVGLRIRFGMKDTVGTKWDGKLVLARAKSPKCMAGGFQPGDSAEDGEWTISTRRVPAQGSGDKARLAAGGKMPMGDNGFTVEMSGTTPDTTIKFDTEPGKYEFKLSDIPYGKTVSALNGNLQIERMPPPRNWQPRRMTKIIRRSQPRRTAQPTLRMCRSSTAKIFRACANDRRHRNPDRTPART